MECDTKFPLGTVHRVSKLLKTMMPDDQDSMSITFTFTRTVTSSKIIDEDSEDVPTERVSRHPIINSSACNVKTVTNENLIFQVESIQELLPKHTVKFHPSYLEFSTNSSEKTITRSDQLKFGNVVQSVSNEGPFDQCVVMGRKEDVLYVIRPRMVYTDGKVYLGEDKTKVHPPKYVHMVTHGNVVKSEHVEPEDWQHVEDIYKMSFRPVDGCDYEVLPIWVPSASVAFQMKVISDPKEIVDIYCPTGGDVELFTHTEKEKTRTQTIKTWYLKKDVELLDLPWHKYDYRTFGAMRCLLYPSIPPSSNAKYIEENSPYRWPKWFWNKYFAENMFEGKFWNRVNPQQSVRFSNFTTESAEDLHQLTDLYGSATCTDFNSLLKTAEFRFDDPHDAQRLMKNFKRREINIELV